jgi:hypothetical protein
VPALLATGCVHRNLPTVHAPPVRAPLVVAAAPVEVGAAPVEVAAANPATRAPARAEPSDRLIELEHTLSDLVASCEDTRAHLEREVRAAERAERVAIGASVAAYAIGTFASARRGTAIVTPPPPSYGPGYRYGVLGSVGPPGPGLTFGASPPGTTGPRLFTSSPISERADLMTLDRAHRIDAINVEIDAAYEDLESSRVSGEVTEADEERFAEHDARLRALCAR